METEGGDGDGGVRVGGGRWRGRRKAREAKRWWGCRGGMQGEAEEAEGEERAAAVQKGEGCLAVETPG